MMKIRSILTGIAISLSLAGMAQSQYDGAPVNRSANETSTDNVEVRRNKYPRSDNDWENFDVLHINRLPSAANFMGYPTKELALQGDKSQSPYFQSLNGTWKFHFVPRSDERPMDFFQKGYDVSGWDDIKVPSNWELQGFGYPFYVGSGYGIKKNPPLIAVENSPVGSYRRTFTIPAHWNKRQIILYFGGVASAFYVWVNGEKVGYSQDSKTPSEFDITPYVKQGENEIAVQVFKFSDGYYLEDQDYWRFAGIQRDVYVYARSETHVRDYEVVTDLDGEYKNADFHLFVELGKAGEGKIKGAEVEVSLLDKAPAGIVGIMRGSYTVDIILFHQLNITQHGRLIYHMTVIRIVFVSVYSFYIDRLAIYQQLSMFDFGFTETDVLGNILFRFAIYTQSNQQSIQIWFLRTP